MDLLHPELLLLAVPAAWLWWRFRDASRATQVLRLLLLSTCVLILAGPHLVRRAPGRDLVVVVDRSRSMPADAEERAAEIVRLAEEARGEGDRVGLVTFGARTRLERLPSASARFDGFELDVDADASDLGAALETALNVLGTARPGRILLVSDGEANGRDPIVAARRAFARGVAIDTLHRGRGAEPDLAVERIDLPDEVAVGEPFQFSVWVRSDARTEAEFALERDGRTLSRGRRVFEGGGLSRLVFRDVVPAGGIADYRVRLSGPPDRAPENDVGLGAVRVVGPRQVLVLNDDGAPDTLTRALESAGLAVVVRSPEAARLDRLALTAFRAVVLENVAADRIGTTGLLALRDHVTERGAGLLVTGGRASFGIGGYHLSAIDRILPVSMEMRQEARKQAIALVIAMDRSGSMAAPVAGELTKMDLANDGAAAAIELLSGIDSVGVLAVDSAPHEIQALVRVADGEKDEIQETVRRIRSGGGGIFTYSALVAAGRMLDEAEQVTRHVILFADAADSEEQQGVPELLADFERMGVTVSVIALGRELDADADFLKRVAARGRGEVYFTTDPSELPRLFAQDTLTVARATFVEERTETAVLPDLFGLGELPEEGFPALDGYNLTYLRPSGVAGVVTTDDYRAPIVAFGYQGIGRTATLAAQIGGTYGRELARWQGFAAFAVTTLRWLVGQEPPADFFPTVRREGRSAVLTVEVEDDALPDATGMVARLEQPDGEIVELPLERAGSGTFEARAALDQAGIALGTLRLAGDRFVDLPPLTLPYSPEFEPTTDPRAGERLLARVADESGGQPLAVAGSFFDGDVEGRAWRSIVRELVVGAIVLMLVEIAFRRLQLGELVRWPRGLGRRWRALAARVVRRRATPASATTPAGAASTQEFEARPSTAPTPSDSKGTPAATDAREESMFDAMQRARREAGRQLDR